jgi:carbon storage regulator CsrA
MLVLSRRCDTSIQIGRDIKVTVLSIRNRQVKLGIEAPRNVRVWRDELCSANLGLLENECIVADIPDSRIAVRPEEVSNDSLF